VNLRNGDQTGTVDRSLKKETNFNKSHFGLRSNLICGIDISEGSFSILGSGSFQGLYRTPDFFNQCLFSISPRMINKFKFYCTNNRCILEISKSTVTGPFKGVLHVGLQIKPFLTERSSPDGIAGGIWLDIPGYIAGPPVVGMDIDGPPSGYCV